MSSAAIKIELQKLIEEEKDLQVLEAIKTLLTKSSLNPELKEKMTSRALKSEQDIKEGRLLNRQEFEEKLKGRMGI